jgi:hypothetical protein
VPEAVARVAALMAGFPATWSLCGGWAVDAWLGRETREHGDVDVSVFADDQRALFEHLDGWQLLAHGPAWEPGKGDAWWDGGQRLPVATHIHARPPEHAGPMPEGGIANAEDGFNMEFYIDALDDGEWVLSSDPRVGLPLRQAVQESVWRVPVAAPEALLFFKACGKRIRLRDHLDFEALLPHLGEEQRTWLREAIALVGHPWLRELAANGGGR